eukprot:TRINITY_DN67172_c0_g1_i1.p1 TRINITY_DN67172_c0_g1~~TRINITY_DN67172_c0_g1_i1.p1  ORF type:complete len:639 (+),score=102.35 TRINITY_DN67172_c0_g1_i1:61-1977(+)
MHAKRRLDVLAQQLTASPAGETGAAVVDKAWLRKKYAQEREKRLRVDGNDQYGTLEGQLSYYKKDRYTTVQPREPKSDHGTFAHVGAGFAGLCVCAGAVRAGISSSDVRLIEKGGDVGGTWYWNRYPGAMCDTAAMVYMPMLEETGHIPSEKYAHGPEILEQSRKIARTHGLYENALFHTEVTSLRWEDEASRWRVETNRGDSFTCTFLGVGTGPFVVPKLPGIPGIESFKGHSFHTSRWDYDYTGGSAEHGGELSAKGGGSKVGQPLTKLADKRVAILGTGATSVQCIPHLAAASEELYVFQRTPSSVDVRGNVPTDLEEFSKMATPGFQTRWQENFLAVQTGMAAPGESDFVSDGWTDLSKRIQKAMSNISQENMSLAKWMAAYEDEDNKKMSEIRARCNEIVRDSGKAELLKAWYQQLCKRPTFHDEYLDSFNRPNVTLVDCSITKGVERITERGLIVGGSEYEVDCIIFASGFEVGGDMARKNGFEIIGQNGVTLTEYWDAGIRTFHGTHVHGFPNLFLQSMVQNAQYIVNVPHNYMESGKALGALLAHASTHGYRRIELSKEEEDKWVNLCMQNPSLPFGNNPDCTPGYYNNEGREMDERAKFNRAYPRGALAYFKHLQKWRADGKFRGLTFR